jgi:hypothetical protein
LKTWKWKNIFKWKQKLIADLPTNPELQSAEMDEKRKKRKKKPMKKVSLEISERMTNFLYPRLLNKNTKKTSLLEKVNIIKLQQKTNHLRGEKFTIIISKALHKLQNESPNPVWQVSHQNRKFLKKITTTSVT